MFSTVEEESWIAVLSDDRRLSAIMASTTTGEEDTEAVDLLVKKLGEMRFKELQEQMGSIAHRFKKRAERHAERAIM